MSKVMISPSRYVQGAGAIHDLGGHVKKLGRRALLLGGKTGMASVHDAVRQGFEQEGIEVIFEQFRGECSKTEIERIMQIVRLENLDVIIGVGGGKALDTAKAVAYYLNLPVAIVPTIAATDAPCSALSVVYTDEGIFESYLILPKNPDLVLVDTAIVAKAPVRLLVSGMGDALATWFEANACEKAFAANLPGGL